MLPSARKIKRDDLPERYALVTLHRPANVDDSATLKGVLESLLSAIAVIAIFAVVGIGVGVLVRNQIAAVIGALAYLFVLEPLIQIIPVVKNVYPYLPGAAAGAITGAGRGAGASPLNPWLGAVVLLGWGVLFAASGWVFTIKRDIP